MNVLPCSKIDKSKGVGRRNRLCLRRIVPEKYPVVDETINRGAYKYRESAFSQALAIFLVMQVLRSAQRVPASHGPSRTTREPAARLSDSPVT